MFTSHNKIKYLANAFRNAYRLSLEFIYIYHILACIPYIDIHSNIYKPLVGFGTYRITVPGIIAVNRIFVCVTTYLAAGENFYMWLNGGEALRLYSS